MTRVAHLMTLHPEVISTLATVGEAGRRMAAARLRHLPVVDHGGVLVGIISDRDLRGPMIGSDDPRPVPAADAPVESIMTREVVTARSDDEVGVAARAIVSHRVGAVPVIDSDGRLIGILSFVDVLRRLANEAELDARAVDRIG